MAMTLKTYLMLTLIALVVLSCGGNANSGNSGGPDSGMADANDVATDLPIAQQIDALIDMDLYEDALERLEGQDMQDSQIRMLREKTHLNYGLHSMMTFDQTEMRTRMNRALRQFTIVLEINPQNRVAREQIDQILMIYGTMPDRSPDPDVLEGLRTVGYEI